MLDTGHGKLVESLLHGLVFVVVDLLFHFNLFLLRSQDVVKVLFKDHHLALIGSVEPAEVDFLLLCVSLHILVGFCENEVPI